jgi:hypothetical protein
MSFHVSGTYAIIKRAFFVDFQRATHPAEYVDDFEGFCVHSCSASDGPGNRDEVGKQPYRHMNQSGLQA